MEPKRTIAAASGGLGLFALVCCVVPILPVLLGAAGLSGFLAFVYRDIILLPVAAILFAIAGGALWLSRRSN